MNKGQSITCRGLEEVLDQARIAYPSFSEDGGGRFSQRIERWLLFRQCSEIITHLLGEEEDAACGFEDEPDRGRVQRIFTQIGRPANLSSAEGFELSCLAMRVLQAGRLIEDSRGRWYLTEKGRGLARRGMP